MSRPINIVCHRQIYGKFTFNGLLIECGCCARLCYTLFTKCTIQNFIRLMKINRANKNIYTYVRSNECVFYIHKLRLFTFFNYPAIRTLFFFFSSL